MATQTPRPASGEYQLRTVAVYIERDGFRREASRDGITTFTDAKGYFRVAVFDRDLPALDKLRDEEYAKVRARQLRQRGY